MKNPQKFWDRLANNFDKYETQFLQPPLELALPYIKGIVLDFGCATGTETIKMAGKADKVIGIDISQKMLSLAQNKVAENNIKNVEFLQSTIYDEKLKPNTFDVIVAFNILHLVENPAVVIQQIHKLLKDNGLFISATSFTGEKSFLNFLQRSIFKPLSKISLIPKINFFKLEDLLQLLTETNFQLIENKQLDSKSNYFIIGKK